MACCDEIVDRKALWESAEKALRAATDSLSFSKAVLYLSERPSLGPASMVASWPLDDVELPSLMPWNVGHQSLRGFHQRLVERDEFLHDLCLDDLPPSDSLFPASSGVLTYYDASDGNEMLLIYIVGAGVALSKSKALALELWLRGELSPFLHRALQDLQLDWLLGETSHLLGRSLRTAIRARRVTLST